ncbi:MAG: hypothetical protein PHR43_02915 [Dehalococcoidales bacterium]|nr:hypothetical protein [Dehalococcoidales bacterium]
MNLTDMRAIVRRELRDEDSGNYRWANDELDRHIARAVKELSEHFPDEHSATLATTAGSRELDIATIANRVMVAAVEYPAGKFPKKYQRFSLWGDTLTLLGEAVPDGSNACVYYGKLHTLDAETSTLPAKVEDLVAAGAAGYAAVAWAVYAVNRVNVGGTMTPREFFDWGKEKLKYFRGELVRLGRRRRLRIRSLYKPYYPVVSRTTDFGPWEAMP